MPTLSTEIDYTEVVEVEMMRTRIIGLLARIDILADEVECPCDETEVIGGFSGDIGTSRGVVGVDLTEVRCLKCGETFWE
jgi:hypothetical protein